MPMWQGRAGFGIFFFLFFYIKDKLTRPATCNKLKLYFFETNKFMFRPQLNMFIDALGVPHQHQKGT